MPAAPRSDVFDPHEVGVYHCWNRLVQRRHLFGEDDISGIDYSYRKVWVRDRFKELAGSMALDVLDYAILDNHLHVVLRNRPDIVKSWSDEEVARRWWYTCPARRNPDGTIPSPKPCELRLLQEDVEKLRSRLSSISWMMRLACQPIARRANQEDDMQGRFFAKRFDCNRLKSQADILACSLYVDLNWVRAGLAETPEDSVFTSAFDRIRARWERTQREMGHSQQTAWEEEADAWLAPVFLDERSDAYEAPAVASHWHDDGTGSPPPARAIPARRASDKGFLPLKVEQYLRLLDLFGRQLRNDHTGSIPADLAPILERLQLLPQQWLESLATKFPTVRPFAAAFP